MSGYADWPVSSVPRSARHLPPWPLPQVFLTRAEITATSPRAVPLSSASIDVLKKLPASDHPSGHRVAIEIERSIKTIKRYEAIFAAYLQMIKQGDYAIVHYVCPDAAFAPRLSRLFQLIQAVPVVGERVPITDKHRARFPVYALQNWPPVASGMDISIG